MTISADYDSSPLLLYWQESIHYLSESVMPSNSNMHLYVTCICGLHADIQDIYMYSEMWFSIFRDYI